MEAHLVPSILEVLVQVSDPVIEDQIRVDMARLVGPLLDELSRYGFDKKYADNFIGFYNVAVKDKLQGMQEEIIKNLPCFMFVFNGHSEHFEYFKDQYLEHCTSPNVAIKASLALSIHEALKLVPYTGSLGSIENALYSLLEDPSREVQQALCQHLNKIISNFAKDTDL